MCVRALVPAIVGLLITNSATAQPIRGAIAGVNVGAVLDSGEAGTAVTGSFLYRMSASIALGMEFVGYAIRPPDIGRQADPFGPFDLVYADPRGRTVTFAVAVRADGPTFGRLVPYGVASGGLATVRESYLVSTVTQSDQVLRVGVVSENRYGMLGTTGGGVSVIINTSFSADVELRYIYNQKLNDHHAMRVGVGLGYRF